MARRRVLRSDNTIQSYNISSKNLKRYVYNSGKKALEKIDDKKLYKIRDVDRGETVVTGEQLRFLYERKGTQKNLKGKKEPTYKRIRVNYFRAIKEQDRLSPFERLRIRARIRFRGGIYRVEGFSLGSARFKNRDEAFEEAIQSARKSLVHEVGDTDAYDISIEQIEITKATYFRVVG